MSRTDRPAGAPAPGLLWLRRTGAVLTRISRPGAWGIALAWMGGIWAFSSVPGSGLPSAAWLGFFANLEHALAFGLLAMWLALGLPRRDGWPRLDARGLAFVLGFVVLYGLVDEWHQASTPGRHPSGWDLITDAVGAACTLWVARYVPRPEADGRGLARRLGLGLLFCAAAAAVATWAPWPPF